MKKGNKLIKIRGVNGKKDYKVKKNMSEYKSSEFKNIERINECIYLLGLKIKREK